LFIEGLETAGRMPVAGITPVFRHLTGSDTLLPVSTS
jgi:hypothetical protein